MFVTTCVSLITENLTTLGRYPKIYPSGNPLFAMIKINYIKYYTPFPASLLFSSFFHRPIDMHRPSFHLASLHKCFPTQYGYWTLIPIHTKTNFNLS